MSVSTKASESPIVSSVNISTTSQIQLPRPSSSVFTSRPMSPVVIVSQPAVVSSQPPVQVLRVLPWTADTTSQAVRTPPAAVTVPDVFGSSTLPSCFRPPSSSTVASYQASFSQAAFSPATVPPLNRLLSPSATLGVHSTRSRLPFSSSSPDLAAAASKHVLIDGNGQVITTVVPPPGNGHRPDDGKLRKNLPVSSVSAAHFVSCFFLVSGKWAKYIMVVRC